MIYAGFCFPKVNNSRVPAEEWGNIIGQAWVLVSILYLYGNNKSPKPEQTNWNIDSLGAYISQFWEWAFNIKNKKAAYLANYKIQKRTLIWKHQRSKCAWLTD